MTRETGTPKQKLPPKMATKAGAGAKPKETEAEEIQKAARAAKKLLEGK